MSQRSIPDDFPRATLLGSVSSYQPKPLLRDFADAYVVGQTDEERFARYDACEALAQQLAPYATRKQAENPAWSLDETLVKNVASVTGKVAGGQWDVPPAEVTWIMQRVRELLAR
jgi:hypothetical protein